MNFKSVSITLAFSLLCISGLSACGGSDQQAALGQTVSKDCPPPPKSSVSAIARAGGMESFEKYSKWQTELPPKSCAGKLANFIPDLPEGYGLPPNVRPPIMTDKHVYLKYVEIPNNVTGEALEMINFAQQPQFEFEIAQLTESEATMFDNWFFNNPNSYSEYNVEGRTFYALGGGGWYMQGHKLTGGIGVILDNNVLIKFTMPRIYADENIATPIAKLFHELATQNGL